MSISFDKWLGDTGDLEGLPTANESQRAVQAWRRIQDRPTSVVFRKTDGTDLAAQTVRLESDNSATPAESAAGVAPKRKLIIFGVRNHPTVTDTDMAEGYRFVHEGDMYTIQDVIFQIGEQQGVAEASG